MTTIIRYISTDGGEWDNPADADLADRIDSAVRKIESALPERPSTSDARIAIEPRVFMTAWTGMMRLCRRLFPNERVFQRRPRDVNPVMSHVGRFISEQRFRSLQRLFLWVYCYADGWLYDNPFYAMNPSKWEAEFGAAAKRS